MYQGIIRISVSGKLSRKEKRGKGETVGGNKRENEKLKKRGKK